MICFFEGENRIIGVSFNEEYDLNRLLELEVSLKAKNNEYKLTFRKSNQTLINELDEPRLFKAMLTNTLTLNKAGEYLLQFKVIDSQLGVRKSEIYGINILRDVCNHENNLVNSEVISHLFNFDITSQVDVIGLYNLNILGATANRLFLIDGVTTGHIITHNYNCEAVRGTYIDEDGNENKNVYFQKNVENPQNSIVCVFPTDDVYNGHIFIEKLF